MARFVAILTLLWHVTEAWVIPQPTRSAPNSCAYLKCPRNRAVLGSCASDDDAAAAAAPSGGRRTFLASAPLAATLGPLSFGPLGSLATEPVAAAAPARRSFSATWAATDGFKDDGFISFDAAGYLAMRNDPRRTPKFNQAIKRRLAGTKDLTVGEAP